MMEIQFSGAGAPYDAMMRQAVATLDWAAVEALIPWWTQSWITMPSSRPRQRLAIVGGIQWPDSC